MANNYYNFPVPFVPGTKVRSEQVNTQYQGVEAGFDLLPTDPVASIIGTAWLATDVQGATVNEYLLTNPDPQSALTNGQRVSFFATHTNTGAVTFNTDGLGVVNAVDNDGTALGANDVISGQYYEFIYDNANTQWTRSLAAGSTSTFPQITATSSNVIDLVDADVALRVGAVDPLTAAHLELDPTTIQAKSDATNVNQLQLNPLGGEVAIGNQSGPPTGESILLYQDGFEMANIDRSALALSAAVVADPTVPGAYEYLIEFYDQDANDFWGSIGWDPATTDMRFRQLGDGGGYIFSGTLDSGAEVTLLTMDPEEGINFLPTGNGPLFVEPAGVSTVSGATYIDNGATVYMAEISAAQVDIGGYGQIWVNDAFTPNRLFFTGDTGVDVDLTTVGGSPGGADTNFQYNNGGVFGGAANFAYNDTTFEITYDPTLPGFGTGLRIEPVNTTGVSVRISDQTMALTSGQLLTASTEANHTGDLVNFSTVANGASGDTLSLFQNGSGFALRIAASGANSNALVINTNELIHISESTLNVQTDLTANANLTSGYVLQVSSDIATKTGGVVRFVQDNSSSAADTLNLQNDGNGTSASLQITQTGLGAAIQVSHSSSDVALSIVASNAAGRAFNMTSTANTGAADFGRLNVNNTSFTGNVLSVVQDHASSTGIALDVRNDGAAPGIALDGEMRFLERADHASTPAATFGYLWVRSDAPNVLVFTDDAGTDFDLNGAGASIWTLDGDDNLYAGVGAGAALVGASALNNLLMGQNAGGSINSGDGNICIGSGPVNGAGNRITTPSDNIAIGNAGNSIVTGVSNIAIGDGAMNSATPSLSGSSNIAIGVGAINSAALTTAAGNIGIGGGSLDVMVSGQTNIGIGNNAGNSLTTGDDNIFIGESAGTGIDSGDHNISIGFETGRGATGTCLRNVAIGYHSARSLGTGDDNVVIGSENADSTAGSRALGDRNVIVGGDNLQGASFTAGVQDQVIFGFDNLQGLTTGDANQAFGRFCLSNITTGTANLGIGFIAGPAVAGAGATQNNRFYLRMTGSPNETPNIGFDPNGGESGNAEFTVSSDGNGNDFVVHDNATAGETRMMVYDVDNATLEQVSVGAADSGGAGFKVLRIPN